MKNNFKQHPWSGLSVPHGRVVDVPKQLPAMVRPVEQRALGPRDHKTPAGVMLMYSGTARGVWSSDAIVFPENLPRVDFAALEARVMARYAK